MFMARLLDWIVQHTNTTLLLNYIPAQENDVMAIYNLCEKETQERIAIDLYGKKFTGIPGAHFLLQGAYWQRRRWCKHG